MILSEYCKATLFCLVFDGPGPRTVVYIQAGTKVAAIRKAMDVMICLHDVGISEVAMTHVASYHDLLAEGRAEVESFRISEARWFSDGTEEWVCSPLILSNDSTLLGAWAALQYEIAAGYVEQLPPRSLLDSGKPPVS
ncbi:hypothetical protein ACQUFY_18940 [Robbsia andropogonis]|uniref:hypothetical protein n=1 Tax=Robbsia andropogonis TaxID=28092 RepID=UPI003D21C5E4